MSENPSTNDSEISLDQLIINENAYFYKKIIPISRIKITQLFTAISKEKIGNRYSLNKVKVPFTHNRNTLEYSICIFKYYHKPSFLSEEIAEWYEVKFSFLLIVEYADYVVIYKNNVAGLKQLYKHLETIDYSIISRLFVDNGTLFEKFYVSNINTADNALRNRSLEATNLQGTISRLGAPKQIIYNMRVANGETKTSVSLNTSRINSLTDKKPLDQFIVWSIDVCNAITAFQWHDTYLDNFAKPVKFEDHIDGLIPLCILIKFDKLQDDLERELIDQIYQVDDNNEIIEGFNLNTLIDQFNSTFDIDINGNDMFVNNPFDNQMRIKKGKRAIQLISPEFKKIKISKAGFTTDLNKFFNFRNDFIVNFTEPKIIYTYRKLFEDHRLLADIEGFLTVFHPLPELNSTTSEKGQFLSTQLCFSQNSLFNLIENSLANDAKILICDDLSDEWADFVAIKDDSIVFYHAKHKDGHGLSASNLQEIIGQAHKNIGYFEPTDAMLDGKRNKWSRNYKSSHVQTQIKRLRIAPNGSIDQALDVYKLALSHPNIKKQINLVIDFISKQQLSSGLQDLVSGRTVARRSEITQILWFVSSLVANCKELGIETYITCKP